MSLTTRPTTRRVHAVKSSFKEGWWLTTGMLIISRSTCQIRSDLVSFGRIRSDSVNCMTRLFNYLCRLNCIFRLARYGRDPFCSTKQGRYAIVAARGWLDLIALIYLTS